MIPDFIVGRGAGKDAGGRIEAEPCGQGGCTQGQGVTDIDVIDGKGVAVGRIFGGCRNGDTGDGGRIVGPTQYLW